MSVRQFAAYLGAGLRTVAAWEASVDIVPRPDMQAALDTALSQASAEEQARFTAVCADVRIPAASGPEPTVEAGPMPRQAARDAVPISWAPGVPRARRDAISLWTMELADDHNAWPAEPTALDAVMVRWLVTPADATVARSGPYRRVGTADVERLRRVRQQLKGLDNTCGGGTAFSLAIAYLRREVVPLLDGRYTETTGRALFGAVAELTLDLGWMAYDAGNHALARAHMTQALRLAHAADDRLFGGRVLCALSHQALHIGQTALAIDLVRAARTGTAGVATPTAIAMFAAMEAMAQAAARDKSACMAAIGAAEEALTDHRPGDDPTWLEFDTGGLLGHTARAYRYLKQGTDCERLAEQSVRACLSDHGRTRAQRYAILAAAYVHQGELEQAAATGEQVIREAWQLCSRHVDEEIAGLVKVIQRKRVPGAQDFLAQARQYLKARSS